jgi:hypothetical protein
MVSKVPSFPHEPKQTRKHGKRSLKPFQTIRTKESKLNAGGNRKNRGKKKKKGIIKLSPPI